MDISSKIKMHHLLMHLRYQILSDIIDNEHEFMKNTEKLNVFVDYESIMKSMSADTELMDYINNNADDANKILKIILLIVSSVINMGGFYKKFFINNNIDVTVYITCTNLNSRDFSVENNEFYKNYYLNKYNTNNIYKTLGYIINEAMNKVKTICSFINNIHMIYTENIDNLYVPMCIQPDKGIIISSDIVYSIYNTIPNYKAIIVKRDKSNRIYTTDNNFLMKTINKLENTPTYYNKYIPMVLYLSVIGDKYRNIDSIKGIGFMKLNTMISELVSDDSIVDITFSKLVGSIFKNNDILDNYNQLDILLNYHNISDSDKFNIYSMISNRYDIPAIVKLNTEMFGDNPINIQDISVQYKKRSI